MQYGVLRACVCFGLVGAERDKGRDRDRDRQRERDRERERERKQSSLLKRETEHLCVRRCSRVGQGLKETSQRDGAEFRLLLIGRGFTTGQNVW